MLREDPETDRQTDGPTDRMNRVRKTILMNQVRQANQVKQLNQVNQVNQTHSFASLERVLALTKRKCWKDIWYDGLSQLYFVWTF